MAEVLQVGLGQVLTLQLQEGLLGSAEGARRVPLQSSVEADDVEKKSAHHHTVLQIEYLILYNGNFEKCDGMSFQQSLITS